MPVTDELRQRQIREVLDYDIIQNKRVFDNQVKNVDAFTETNAQPKKADIEFEAEVKSKVGEIVIKLNSLVTNISDKAKRDIQFNYGIIPEGIEIEEEVPGTEGSRGSTTSGLISEAMRDAGLSNRLSLERSSYLTDMQNTIDNILASIYSSYNSLVDRINSRFRNSQGFSAQGKSNIMALLQPLTDSAKEALSSIIVLKETGDETLYNRAYNLIYEIIQSIDNAYPLMRLDITKITDSHYATVPQIEINTDEYRKQMGSYYEEASAKQQQIESRLGELRGLLDEIRVIESTENFDPEDQNYQDLVNTYRALEADFAEFENEGGEVIRNAIAKAVAKERRDRDEVSVIGDEIIQRIRMIEQQIQELKDRRENITSGFRKVSPQTLRGIDIKINRLTKNLTDLYSAAPQIQQAYKTFNEANPFAVRDPGQLGLQLPTAAETMTAPVAQLQEQAMRAEEQRAGLPQGFFERIGEGKKKGKKKEGGMMRKPQSKVRDIFADVRTRANAVQPNLGNQIVEQARNIRRDNPEINQNNFLQRLRDNFTAFSREVRDVVNELGPMIWNILTDVAGLVAGARKDLTPDEVNAVMIKRNNAFAKNNIDTQPAEGEVPYLGLKPDNSLGAGRDALHPKLGSGSPGKKFDAESAKVLDNLIQKEKVKAGAKKSKKSKQLPTLIFDDKKNDWYL